MYTDDAKYAEICLCGSKNCRAFIAKISIDVMQRSIPRYVGVLNEMETHNILESQRLDKLETALRKNQTLTSKEKEDAEHLKYDNEELRLTKRKAIYLKKGVLMAKAKLVELQNEERYNNLVEAQFSHLQVLPDLNDEMDSLHESVASRASTPNSLVASSIKIDYEGETSKSMENSKELKGETLVYVDSSKESKGETLAFIESTKEPKGENLFSVDSSKESKGETSAFTESPKEPKGETLAFTENSKEPKVDPLTISKNPREHCVSEYRVARALHNDGLPLSVKIPLPLTDDEQCVLMGVKDIDKLLEESRLSSERSKNSCSPLQMPKCTSVSCLSPPPHSPTSSPRSRKSDQSSSSTPHLNQYDLAIHPGQVNRTNETFSSDEDKQDSKGKKPYKLTAIYRIKTSKEINELDSTEPFSIIKKVMHIL
jgi:hypothetical protein